MLLIVGVVQDVRVDPVRSGAGGESYTPRTLVLDVGSQYPEYVALSGKSLADFVPVKGEYVALEVSAVPFLKESRVFVNLKAWRVADLPALAAEQTTAPLRSVAG